MEKIIDQPLRINKEEKRKLQSRSTATGVRIFNNGAYGRMDEDGKWLVNPDFEDMGYFHEGLAKVKMKTGWGFIEPQGKVVINADFESVTDFENGLSLVKYAGKYGFINAKGEWVVKPIYIQAGTFKNGIARVRPASKKGWNFIDTNGKVLFRSFH